MTQILLCIALITSLWYIRKNTQELKQIQKALNQYINGNLSYRLIIPGKSQRSQIAEQLNTLANDVQQKHEQEQRQKKAHQDLLTNISHDLRTPLTSIAGYVDAMQRHEEENERYLNIISQKTEEVVHLTNDLFYLTKLNSGDLQLKKEPVDLNELLRQTVLGFLNQLEKDNIHLDIPEEPCLVEADTRALQRIFSNIISNSIKHGKEKKNFGIKLEKQPCIITIWDDGKTILNHEKIFTRGFSHGGTGLGLSIARELAEQQHIELTLETNKNNSFILKFPKELRIL